MGTVAPASPKCNPSKTSSYRVHRVIRQVRGVRSASRDRAAAFLMFACSTCSTSRSFGFSVGAGEPFNPYPLLRCEHCGGLRLHQYRGVGR